MRCALVCLLALLTSCMAMGCTVSEVMSLNVQKATIRSTTDVATTILLDNQDALEVEEYRVGMERVCGEILKFLETGQVEHLTKGELALKLTEIVSSDYEPFVDTLMSAVAGVHTDIEVVGGRNLKRIRAVLRGVIVACNDYDLADRAE